MVKNMNYLAKKNKQQGLATLEMLIAMAIIVVAISAALPLVSGGQSISVSSQTNQEALYKAQLGIENARATARNDFYSPSLDPGTTTTTETSGIVYTKNITIASGPDDFTKEVTSQVTWGTDQQITLSTLVADWNAALTGDTCSPVLAGDWTNPQLLGTADVGENNGGTDIDTFNKKVYVTANASSADKHDFYIIDASDPTVSNLPVLGSVNTGPGLASVKSLGGYAYVANMSTTSQLQIIDVDPTNTPTVINDLDVTAALDTAVGNSVYYLKGRVYLGLTKSTGPEFYIIDASDPSGSLNVLATLETNTQINDILVRGDIAYLALPDDPDDPGVKQLIILDISDAENGNIGQLDTYGPNPTTMSSQSIFLSKDANTLYLGQGGANPANNDQFFVLNVTDPSSIGYVNSKYIDTANDVTVNAVTVRSNLAFMVTSDPSLGFQIWDLNNLGNSTPYGSINVEQASTGGMDCEGNFIYIAQRSQKALQIIGPGIAMEDPTITTTILNSDTGNIVTSVPSGTNVYAKATIAGSAGTPTGTVDFTLYTNKDNCTGAKTDYNGLSVNSGVAVTPDYTTTNKSISYQAHYNGDTNYNPADGVCQPLEVIP